MTTLQEAIDELLALIRACMEYPPAGDEQVSKALSTIHEAAKTVEQLLYQPDTDPDTEPDPPLS